MLPKSEPINLNKASKIIERVKAKLLLDNTDKDSLSPISNQHMLIAIAQLDQAYHNIQLACLHHE